MKVSLDTNVIIHLYRANHQNILFDVFTDDICMYEQIRDVELEHHGKDILSIVDKDIASGKITLFTDCKLKELSVYKIFENNVKENKILYGAGDLGEVYAISLAQTIGGYSIVTDDIKQGGPYMSLLQFEDEVMPFTFVDVLIIRYLTGLSSSTQTIKDFIEINTTSNLNWSFRSHLSKFIRRFFLDPYRKEDTIWIRQLINSHNIQLKTKLKYLSSKIESIGGEI